MDHNHLNIKTFMAIMAERDAAIQERNLALDGRKRAFAESDLAMLQRDAALAERNSAMQARDEAISTLRFGSNFINENTISTSESPEHIQSKRTTYNYQETHHVFKLPENSFTQTEPYMNTKNPKIKPDSGTNEESCDEVWKDELGLNRVNFDESAMPVPVCSCTGVPQPCYRWGNGGWQSACCTTTLSVHPLPPSE